MTTILSQVGGASYDRIDPPQSNPAEGNGGVDIDIVEPDEDTVDVGGNAAGGPGSYGPSDFQDRFRFELQNGMRDSSQRYSPLRSQSGGLADSGYDERGNVEVLVTQTAGSGSTYSALFNLQYRDAAPDSDTARTSVAARTAFTRMNDQNLSLLSSL